MVKYFILYKGLGLIIKVYMYMGFSTCESQFRNYNTLNELNLVRIHKAGKLVTYNKNDK